MLPATALLPGLPVELVRGDQDEYVRMELFEQQATALRAHGALVSAHTFAGGHTLHAPLLRQLGG